MIELNQLEQLVCIAKMGTISKASEKLLISQPALSRSMQKLESEIDVPLFDHYKNKVILNKNGELVVKEAKKILNDVYKMVENVQTYNRYHQSISIASCAPAPLWDIEPLIEKNYSGVNVITKIINLNQLLDTLRKNEYQMVITPFKVHDQDLVCYPYIEEDLYLSIPFNHRLKNKKEVSFKDLDGETMLLYSDIGFWYDLHVQTMPNTKFLIQNERLTFNEIVKASTLPSFTTNLSMKKEGKMNNRVIIPFSNEDAHVTFYVVMLRKNRKQYLDLIEAVKNYYDF